jgi:hypothetical protein
MPCPQTCQILNTGYQSPPFITHLRSPHANSPHPRPIRRGTACRALVSLHPTLHFHYEKLNKCLNICSTQTPKTVIDSFHIVDLFGIAHTHPHICSPLRKRRGARGEVIGRTDKIDRWAHGQAQNPLYRHRPSVRAYRPSVRHIVWSVRAYGRSVPSLIRALCFPARIVHCRRALKVPRPEGEGFRVRVSPHNPAPAHIRNGRIIETQQSWL